MAQAEIEKSIAPLAPLFSDIRDAIKFITRKQRLPQRVLDEAALAAIREIHGHQKRHANSKMEIEENP